MGTTTIESVPITLADGEHALRFDNRALKAVERDLGCSFSKVGDLLSEGDITVSQVEILIVAGLTHEGATFSDEARDALFDGVSLPHQMECVTAGLMAAFGLTESAPDPNARGSKGRNTGRRASK